VDLREDGALEEGADSDACSAESGAHRDSDSSAGRLDERKRESATDAAFSSTGRSEDETNSILGNRDDGCVRRSDQNEKFQGPVPTEERSLADPTC
jgi:hypothetical protein